MKKQNLLNNKKLINTKIYQKIIIYSKISPKIAILDKINNLDKKDLKINNFLINKILSSLANEIFRIKDFKNNLSKIKKTIKDLIEIFNLKIIHKKILHLIIDLIQNNNLNNSLQIYLLNLNIYQRIKDYILLCKLSSIEIKKQNNYLFKVKKKNYVEIYQHFCLFLIKYNKFPIILSNFYVILYQY